MKTFWRIVWSIYTIFSKADINWAEAKKYYINGPFSLTIKEVIELFKRK